MDIPPASVAAMLREIFPDSELLQDGEFFAFELQMGAHRALVRFASCEDTELSAIRARIESIAAVIERLTEDAADRAPEVLHALDQAALKGALAGLRFRGPRAPRSKEEALERLVEHHALGRWLRPDSDTIAALLAVEDWIERGSSMAGKGARMWFMDPTFREGGIQVTARLAFFDGEEIANLMEQPVTIARVGHLSEPGRIVALLDGTAAAFEILADRVGLERFFPADLVRSELLSLKRARTAEDFAAALLRRWKIGDSTGEQ